MANQLTIRSALDFDTRSTFNSSKDNNLNIFTFKLDDFPVFLPTLLLIHFNLLRNNVRDSRILF